MGRLIDETKVLRDIDAIRPVDPQKSDYTHGIDVGLAMAKVAIKGQQTAQQWIPCERELPDVGRSVLISVGGMYTAEGCLREDGDWTQFRWDAIQRKDMVGAWKPLEEPWKGEQDE